MRFHPLADEFFAPLDNDQRQRVNTMKMGNNGLRQDRMKTGFYGRPQSVGIQVLDDKIRGLFRSGVPFAQGLDQRRDLHGHHDVAFERMRKPGARCLDPHDAVLLYRSVTARP
nr:hypothetical protein [Marinicella sp. W31]MDC2880242.1 hypothetical protein [Marinicella sp. W31]